MERRSTSDDFRSKGRKFVRYLTTRPTECWGFFAAGFLICAILT